MDDTCGSYLLLICVYTRGGLHIMHTPGGSPHYAYTRGVSTLCIHQGGLHIMHTPGGVSTLCTHCILSITVGNSIIIIAKFTREDRTMCKLDTTTSTHFNPLQGNLFKVEGYDSLVRDSSPCPSSPST